MSRPGSFFVGGGILASLLLLAGLRHQALRGDDAVPPILVQDDPIVRIEPCLQEPVHWSTSPELAQGVELVCSRYLRFRTPEGRTINARMFLTEFFPRRTKFGDDVPDDVQKLRRTVPDRMACIGHEITADENYEPDFEVAAMYVKPAGRCAYVVNLGAVDCYIRTTPPEKPQTP